MHNPLEQTEQITVALSVKLSGRLEAGVLFRGWILVQYEGEP